MKFKRLTKKSQPFKFILLEFQLSQSFKLWESFFIRVSVQSKFSKQN